MTAFILADTGWHSDSPAGTLADGHRHSGCPRLPTGPGWTAGSAGKLYVPPCHDRGPSPTECQTPSWCLRAAGWTVCPMGCEVSLEHPPTLEHLKQERNDVRTVIWSRLGVSAQTHWIGMGGENTVDSVVSWLWWTYIIRHHTYKWNLHNYSPTLDITQYADTVTIWHHGWWNMERPNTIRASNITKD